MCNYYCTPTEGTNRAVADELALRNTGNAIDQRLARVLDSLEQQLQSVEQWPTQLLVV